MERKITKKNNKKNKYKMFKRFFKNNYGIWFLQVFPMYRIIKINDKMKLKIKYTLHGETFKFEMYFFIVR